jgi:phytoene synthase
VTHPADHLAGIVRAGDPDRYLSDLFAPAAVRPHLFALHAFAVEVASIRGKVSEPMLGEIRLRWWGNALRGEHGGSPVAAALAETIDRFGLPITAFDNLLRARVFDLYDDPLPTLNDLEGYAGDTESALMQLGAMILAGGRDPGTAEVAGHAGVARTIVAILCALPRNLAGGQTFLPADLLAEQGLVLADLASDRIAPRLGAVLAALRVIARGHIDAVRRHIGDGGQAVQPAFLPLAVADTILARMARPGFDPFRHSIAPGPLRRQWAIWRAARLGRL